jgi:Mce-associated membrane protein
MVAIAAVLFGLLASVAVAVPVVLMVLEHRHAAAAQDRNQRFVDTATQTVVNMFSFKQNNVEDSVNRFYAGTSGPLRDTLSQGQNVENLKAILRDTGGSSEAVINGAALEGIDGVSDNASVLVSVRVTVSDTNGNNRPSQAYRMRVVVHEDEQGRMTTYDLKYPNGGN